MQVMSWVVMAWVSEVVQALVVGSCSRMRMTPIRSGRPAFLYQAFCAAAACRNLSIMPGLMSERRTTLRFPEHGIGAVAGACCAAAGVGQNAGVRDALKTVRASNRRERPIVMSPMRRHYHAAGAADQFGPANLHNELHDEGELFELFLHALEGAADSLDAGRCAARGVIGDAVSAHVEEGADQLRCLPGIQTGLHEFLAQRGEIGQGEFFGSAGCRCVRFHGHSSFPTQSLVIRVRRTSSAISLRNTLKG